MLWSPQNAKSRVPDNIIAGRRTKLETLGIVDARHLQLVDMFTQVSKCGRLGAAGRHAGLGCVVVGPPSVSSSWPFSCRCDDRCLLLSVFCSPARTLVIAPPTCLATSSKPDPSQRWTVQRALIRSPVFEAAWAMDVTSAATTLLDTITLHERPPGSCRDQLLAPAIVAKCVRPSVRPAVPATKTLAGSRSVLPHSAPILHVHSACARASARARRLTGYHGEHSVAFLRRGCSSNNSNPTTPRPPPLPPPRRHHNHHPHHNRHRHQQHRQQHRI